jgi:hypothetical protein
MPPMVAAFRPDARRRGLVPGNFPDLDFEFATGGQCAMTCSG